MRSPPPAKLSEKVFPTLINLICNNSDAAAQAPRHKSQRQKERETPHSVLRCVSVGVCVFIAVPFMRGHSGPFRGVAAWIVYANMQCETQKPSTPNMSVSQSVRLSVSQSVSQLGSQSGTQSVRGSGQRAFIFIRLIARVGP